MFTNIEALLGHIQAYSQPYHIPSPGIFRTIGMFKTL